MYELASVTNALVQVATQIIDELGYPGIFVLLVMGSAAIPVSSEAVMLLAGFDVYNGRFEILAIVIVGVAGDLVGASIAWGIGFFGRTEILHQHGRRIHLTPERLERTERWFARYGAVAVPVCRIIPLVRAYMSFPAGAARMRYGRFIGLTALGGVPWIIFWGVLGRALGAHYHSIERNLHYVDVAALVLIVAAIAYVVVRRRRRRAAAAAA